MKYKKEYKNFSEFIKSLICDNYLNMTEKEYGEAAKMRLVPELPTKEEIEEIGRELFYEEGLYNNKYKLEIDVVSKDTDYYDLGKSYIDWETILEVNGEFYFQVTFMEVGGEGFWADELDSNHVYQVERKEVTSYEYPKMK